VSGPELVTERLELWRPQIADRAGLLTLIAPAAVREFLGPAEASETDVFARQLRNAGSWALYGYGVFSLRERGGDGAIVGTCGVFRSFRGFGQGMDDVPEAGWIIAESAWGKGYAIEAMRAALAWFDREHGPQRIACMIEEGHEASAAIAAKLGFVEYARHEPEGERALALYERVLTTQARHENPA
jgi:RimJ/RimL family protein N-acetyltransferase